MQYQSLMSEYASLWDALEISPNRQAQAASQVNRILQNRQRYEDMSIECGVPWFVIGLIHMLEADGDFERHLHNGDPLTARTRSVPRGRPTKGSPPFDWEDSAIDALTLKRLDKVTDWTVERIAYELERYNGWGYRLHHPTTLSPYLWSGSQHYARGKYVADGAWSSTAVSKQIGGMVLLLQLATATSINVRPQRRQRQRIIARAATPERLGRANELKLDAKSVGVVAGLGGAGAASAVQAVGAMPSWQTIIAWALAAGLAIVVLPRLWRFMNAR